MSANKDVEIFDNMDIQYLGSIQFPGEERRPEEDVETGSDGTNGIPKLDNRFV